MNDAQLLDTICQLSHEFGQDDYVKGGGGNTSCKTDGVLFIKPSGTTLAGIARENFVALDRARMNELYAAEFPKTVNERESAVVQFVAGTVMPGYAGRPSVEAPLHNSFPQRYVVHTHPPLVNGMTCGRKGGEYCAKLFPEALWVPMTEPGYTLALRVRQAMLRYQEERGRAPEMIFLANHGVFIAHDEAEGIRALYADVLAKIANVVKAAGKAGTPVRGATPAPEAADKLAASVRAVIGDAGAFHAVTGRFQVPTGAISPDHIVYSKARMYDGDASPASLRAFRESAGYWPRVVATPEMVFGFGASQKVADLALQLAADGAEVVRYAEAFGGIEYMDKASVHFIENWEVESYREKLSK